MSERAQVYDAFVFDESDGSFGTCQRASHPTQHRWLVALDIDLEQELLGASPIESMVIVGTSSEVPTPD